MLLLMCSRPAFSQAAWEPRIQWHSCSSLHRASQCRMGWVQDQQGICLCAMWG